MEDQKRVYSFGAGKAEGRADMRNELGGKGANLAEMNLIGVPVPPGFTITTDTCNDYYKMGKEQVVALLREDVEKALHGTEELMASKEWSIQEIAWLLAIGFGTVWAATSISSMVFGAGFRSAGRILLITTFSIILAQVPAVRKLRGNFDLGLFVAVLFLVTIGFAVDLKQFFGSTFYITLFCFCVIACSILLHLLITRLLKVRFEYVLLSIVGCILSLIHI